MKARDRCARRNTLGKMGGFSVTEVDEPDWSGSLLRLADYVGSVVESTGAIDPDERPELTVATALVTRAVRNLRAVELLASANFDLESHAVVRMIFEDMVDLAYIAAEPDKRAREWCAHCIVRQVFWARDVLLEDPGASVSPNVIAANARIAEEERASGRARANRDWKLWPDVDRRERARRAGVLWWYDDEYRFMCDLAHSSGITLQIYSKADDSGARVPLLAPQGTLRVYAARSAIEAAHALGGYAARLGLTWEASPAFACVDPGVWTFGE